MFQFLQPILLFSIAAIAIPVIIHLWNVKQGKTLKVGSISLLTQASRQSASSLKLHDLLLLFLRCLLITLLACILAEPLFQQPLSVKKEKGWILLEKENLHESYNRCKPAIDSFLKSGYEFHYFNAGFQKDDLGTALKIQKDTVEQPTDYRHLTTDNSSLTTHHSPLTTHISYWNLLKELNQTVPSELPVAVFVKNDLQRFSGERPSVFLNLHLQSYIPADTVSSFIAKAFITASDSIHLLIGYSKPSGTSYAEKNLPLTTISTADYKTEINNGKLMVSLNNSQPGIRADTSFIEVDTSATRVTVFTDKFRNDANYVRAAIESIRRFSKQKLQLSIVNNDKDIPANQDWLFWLSDQTIPFAIAAKNILMYEKGKAENIHSWIMASDETNQDQQPVEITKVIAQKVSNGMETLWVDGYGKPLLTKELKRNPSVYHFFSRFDPEWNDLVWSEEFPKLIIKLLFKEDNNADRYDKRMIDQKQLQPVILAKNEVVIKDKFIQKNDLTHFIWLAAFIVFFLERWISFSNKKTVVYG